MISIVNYLFEGKVAEHFKRNKGKYALGALGATTLGAGLTSGPYHEWQFDRHVKKAIEHTPEFKDAPPIAGDVTQSIGKFTFRSMPENKLQNMLNDKSPDVNGKVAQHMKEAIRHEIARRNSWTEK